MKGSGEKKLSALAPLFTPRPSEPADELSASRTISTDEKGNFSKCFKIIGNISKIENDIRQQLIGDRYSVSHRITKDNQVYINIIYQGSTFMHLTCHGRTEGRNTLSVHIKDEKNMYTAEIKYNPRENNYYFTVKNGRNRFFDYISTVIVNALNKYAL